jgi:hypothetical protein
MYAWPRLVCAGFVCLATSVASAQTPVDPDVDDIETVRRYSVEIIVFSYTDRASSGSEVFIPDPVEVPADTSFETETETPVEGNGLPTRLEEPLAAPDSDLAPVAEIDEETVPAFGAFPGDFEDQELIELIASDRIDLQVMMPDELTMIDIHDKLLLLDAYEPVMWGGWTQVTLPEAETPSIRLRRLGTLPLDFDGDLKLYLSRFLHLVINVTMDGDAPVPLDTESNAGHEPFESGYLDEYGYPIQASALLPPLHYRILENRIVKNEDLRYFDHPKFGILAKIGRYEQPVEEEGIETEPADLPEPGVELLDAN